MKIQIKTTFGDVRFEGDFESLAAAVVTAVESGAKLSAADLSAANLSGANLSGAKLSAADLYGANLYGADLSGADLSGADLYGANLYGANLYGAKLSAADLSAANLSRANLSGADLSGADLYGANLSGADLSRANLYEAKDAALAVAQTRILPAGDLIGWKKCVGGHIVKLSIPADAKRSHAFGRKCRAEWANVLEIVDAKGEALKETKSGRGGIYKTGKRVAPDSWDDNWQNECAGGIHFFITREEAEAYTP